MVLKDMANAYTVLKIFAESTKAILYMIEGTGDKPSMLKSHLSETIGRLQDVLDNIEVE